ncbi:L-serine ammonia-lyase [Corynebacterium uberis]|uniref:L-serine ammonia-lyase n=1 Tax=Corynebacterium uberis TaxID=2883169 RepID=UPI001D0BBEAE|nr:L-serine ammonia-lyase [Corynebacterium uberis]UDL74203.1 L-serine ammonia-lyase [Corynebacterium uberis]
MTISVVDMFSIGIGPSSSHTVGPMRAAKAFADGLSDNSGVIRIQLRGSLAATGRGHGTDRAVVLGLAGYDPVTVPADAEPAPGASVPVVGSVTGPGGTFRYEIDFNPVSLELHPNGLIFSVHDGEGNPLAPDQDYYSVGGGFILTGKQLRQQLNSPDGLGSGAATQASDEAPVPFPFSTAEELLKHCEVNDLSIAEVVAANEDVLHRDEGGLEFVYEHLDRVWRTMRECVAAGIATSGILPGGLNVVRRAPELHEYLLKERAEDQAGFGAMEWVNLYALAVNEENAAGGRVVTAPTNGAAGIIPAVMHYARDFLADFNEASAREFLLTAGAVGAIIKQNASISGAEVGCQGEVGSASSMAAGGLCAVIGGSARQVETAAEIGLEHNLGLTCDPVAGLVQIPCIERNAIGAVKSINAARLARLGHGTTRVTLDDVVHTMAETGRDMLTKYKETATGGLAVTLGLPVSLTEC